jgi:hypothetical protein
MSYSTYGMITSLVEFQEMVKIADVAFDAAILILRLNDGREIRLNMTQYHWLQWLHAASEEQRAKWEIVPSGGGVWWFDLDNGVELQPLLDSQPLPVMGGYNGVNTLSTVVA